MNEDPRLIAALRKRFYIPHTVTDEQVLKTCGDTIWAAHERFNISCHDLSEATKKTIRHAMKAVVDFFVY